MNRTQKRNSPCRCGSGKKSKLCCGLNSSTKPRNAHATFDMGTPVKIDQIRWRKDKNNMLWGSLLTEGESAIPCAVIWQIDTPRNNPAKPVQVLSRIPLLKHNQTEWPIDESLLLRQFDVLIAIDTNSLEPGGIGKSVGVFMVWVPIIQNVRGWEMITKQAIFCDWPNSAEKRNWIEIINWVQNRPQLINKTIGIITDHDLGAHHEINERSKPIIDDIYLPSNMWLLYGTSNAATTENIPNKLVHSCDKEGTALLKDKNKWPKDWLPAI